MASIPPPTFGRPEPGRTHRKRPCAFAVAARDDGRIACVQVTRAGRSWLDLPGGKIERGETETEALVREFAEETGLSCRPGRLIVRTRQYLVTAKGKPRLNLSGYFAAAPLDSSGTPQESDHELLWLEPLDAVRRLRDEAAALAVTLWLRASE